MLVAGGGVAALEACLFLRAYVTENDVDIDLLAPNQVFSYRPLSVLESFGGARAWSMPLDRFAADQDVTLVHDALGTVLGRRAGDRHDVGRALSVRPAARRDRSTPHAAARRGPSRSRGRPMRPS